MTNYIKAVIESVIEDLLKTHSIPSPALVPTTALKNSELAFNKEVCEELRKKGWRVSIVDKHMSEINLKSLYHNYLLFETDMGEEIYIDPFFRSQFEIFHPCDGIYESAMDNIPEIFIGTYTELCAYVKYMAKQVKRLFIQSHIDIPPWRTQRAFLSKWRIYHI